jgi:hypothetical protein
MTVQLDDIARPDTVGVELASRTAALTAALHDIVIVDLLTLERQIDDRRRLGEMLDRVDAFFDPLVQMAHSLWKALTERRRGIKAPIEALDARKRDAIAAFKQQEDRARREREQAIALDQQRARDAAAAAEAAALERSGDAVGADAVLREAIDAPPPVVALPDALRTIDGLTFRRRWTWKYAGGPAVVKDTPPDVLARALAKIPPEFLMVDEKKIGAYARSMKASGSIPGIQIYYVDDPLR